MFIELHEDVVLADSLEQDSAKFEFNQIKNFSSPPWKQKNLLSRKGGKNSILGKLLLGIKGKPFYPKLSSVNLVATCGFNLEQKKTGMKLELICTHHLTDEAFSQMKAAIKKETGADEFPDFIQFITPDLPATGFRDATIGRISNLIDQNFSGCHFNPNYIYRSLIDELHKKGQINIDYEKWQDLVAQKGLARHQVEKVINEHLSRKNDAQMLKILDDVSIDLGLKVHQKLKLRNYVERYYNSSRFTRTALQLETDEAVRKLVEKYKDDFYTSGIQCFLDNSLADEEAALSKFFDDPEQRKAALICELISRYLYESA